MSKSSNAFFASCTLAISASLFNGSAALAQTAPDSASPVAPAETSLASVPLPTPSLTRVFKDTALDFRHLPSRESLTWLTVGAGASILGHAEDSRVTLSLARPKLQETFESGTVIGGLPLQLGSAVATYTVGRLTNSSRTANLGAELIRAQTVAQTVAWGLKYASGRTRPDGTSYSFPSGHAAVSFATATVLQSNFGWKVGLPAYGLASFVATSRIQTKRHYLSDVAFGAALGVMAGKTVTIGHGNARLAVAPMAAPGGGGVSFTLLGKR